MGDSLERVYTVVLEKKKTRLSNKIFRKLVEVWHKDKTYMKWFSETYKESQNEDNRKTN